MVGLVSHSFSATQAEALSNSNNVATTWVGPNEWNSAHAVTVTLTGSTAGASTVASSNIILGASQNLTLSGGAGTIWVQGPQLSAWAPNNQNSATPVALGALAASAASIFGNMFVLPVEIAAAHFDYYMSLSGALGGASYVSSSTSHTSTTTGATSINAGLWSRQGGTSTGTLTLISSQQIVLSASISQSGSSSSHSDSVSLTWTLGNPTSSASATFSGTAANTSGVSLTSGASVNSWQNNLFVIPNAMTATLEPGEYFGGLMVSTAGSTVLQINTTGLNIMFCKQTLANATTNPIGLLGSVNTTNKAAAALYYQGAIMTGASANALPSAFTLTNFQQNTFGFPLLEIVNYATNSALYP